VEFDLRSSSAQDRATALVDPLSKSRDRYTETDPGCTFLCGRQPCLVKLFVAIHNELIHSTPQHSPNWACSRRARAHAAEAWRWAFAVYNYDRNFGTRLFRSQLIFQHHIGGADGLRGDVPFSSNEGYFADLNQFYLFLELVF
jgi:hypothetical protein